MDKIWYYSNGSERKGPVNDASLHALVDAGVVRSDTLLWSEGMSDWEAAAHHLSGLMSSPSPSRLVNGTSFPNSGAQSFSSGPTYQTHRNYHEKVSLGEAFIRGFANYVKFSGRSNRGEFWWFTFATVLISFATLFIDGAFIDPTLTTTPLNLIWSLATFIPGLAVGVRRLHDTDRSGWWWLIIFVPLVGTILLIVWWSQKGTPHANQYG